MTETERNENPFAGKRSVLLAYRENRDRIRKNSHIGGKLGRLADPGSATELWGDLETADPLNFPGYRDKLSDNILRTGSRDALMAVSATVMGIPVIACELSSAFLMGSMGTVVGEKVARAAEEADRRRCPLIIFTASGGARMQEGMYSLLQMEKTASAIRRFKKHGGLYISILTDPTTGGVSASFASLGDIILAEPDALIGFAGPRVISQTIHQKLPKGFQRAQFQLEHGFVDRIAAEEDIREEVGKLLRLHQKGCRSGGEDADGRSLPKETDICPRVEDPEAGNSGSHVLSAFDRLALVRAENRPRITDYIPQLFDDFVELDGDRCGSEDPAILGGIASFEGTPVTVIGHRKGKDIRENVRFNFGMPNPGGYRKALRLMREAEKFGRPVVTFVDTPGAYPGKEAEENGISAAIADNLEAMSDLSVPILSIVTGEGSSGGALGIGIGDRILMLENAVYPVLSPEGFASILWKDGKRVKEACSVMGITAEELSSRGLVDGVIEEPEGGIQTDLAGGCGKIRQAIREFLSDMQGLTKEELTARRYRKYRTLEGALAPSGERTDL